MPVVTINGKSMNFGSDGKIFVPEYRFVIVVDTTITSVDSSDSNTMIIPTRSTTTDYNCMVDWGDGIITEHTGSTPLIQHTYSTGGKKVIKISGRFPTIYFNNTGDKDKLLEIKNLGKVEWESLYRSFYGCVNLEKILGNSDTSRVDNITEAFRCYNLKIFDVNIDMSNVVRANQAFHNNTELHTLNISSWDTSSLVYADYMFRYCYDLKIDLSLLNVTSLRTAWGIFGGCDINEEGTTDNYDNTLESWASQSVQKVSRLDMGNSKYSQRGEIARNILINTYEWFIEDGGLI